MLDKLTLEMFEPLVGQAFETEGLSLTLVQVNRLGKGPNPVSGRWGFSLILLGPAAPLLPQQIYSLQTPSIGMLDLFMVPLGPKPSQPDFMQYEIIFT